MVNLGKMTRRKFICNSAMTAVAAGMTFTAGYVAEDNTIQVALVGCGGRGTGAAFNALRTKGPTKLVAMADVFEDRLNSSLEQLHRALPKQVDVPPERRFIGFDAYKKAIDCISPGGVVLLATPPVFRPLHLEYAVSKGCHVFMEKAFAVDAPGVRKLLKAGEEAQKKNLKIASGLHMRHYTPLEEAIARIHDGIIGDIVVCWAYRMHGPVGIAPRRKGESELAYQIRNFSCFTWLNGGFILDWLIHNLDVCCWVKGQWTVWAQGHGGRQQRKESDQLFDHYAVEYSFPDGARLFAQGRHMVNCWNFWGCIIHGTKGLAVLGEGIQQPRIYKGWQQEPQNLLWRYEGPPCDPYQKEIDLLFEAIREDKPYNETERSAMASMVGIIGRMAAESGQMIAFDQAMKSSIELAPNLENMTFESEPPVKPDPEGKYPIAIPGFTKVL
ncbi:MAG: Gfo/Idh/MocA family oxidoreductase [Armatimonadota bacterium]|nr:Gfo/Idh/MocA family oxidoreductase [Armatimonadota bacterium]MDW8026446.1 Gfo/Idh/MocA family oxidoreductase [Armatimonadota bacterium]